MSIHNIYCMMGWTAREPYLPVTNKHSLTRRYPAFYISIQELLHERCNDDIAKLSDGVINQSLRQSHAFVLSKNCDEFEFESKSNRSCNQFFNVFLDLSVYLCIAVIMAFGVNKDIITSRPYEAPSESAIQQ